MGLVILIRQLILLVSCLLPSMAGAFVLAPNSSESEFEKLATALDDALADLSFDYPIAMEPEVRSYLQRFAGQDQQIMRGWLARMGLYEDIIYAELASLGCPKELIAVAMIESGFDPDAYSRAGAVGVWQFMLPTAREMGARIDDWIDERRHLQASTRLAARLLKRNYEKFGNWHLALAAYNAGAGAVSRAVRAAGTNDYWEIIRQGFLPREASNYVPKAIAAMIVISYPNIAQLETVVKLRPSSIEYVSVGAGTDLYALAKSIGSNPDQILDLNPHLRRGVVPPDGEDFALLVPKDLKKSIVEWIQKKDERGGEVFEPVTLRFGERLNEVAWRRQLSLRRLRVWNDVKPGAYLVPGTKIFVPAQSKERSFLDRNLVAINNGEFIIEKGRKRYFFPILYAQSLAAIAEWFDLKMNEVRLWNGLSEADRVPEGLALAVWLKEKPENTLFVDESDLVWSTSFAQFESTRRYRPSAIKVVNHTVKKGDTLWGISKKYQSPVSAIKRENGASNRMRLRIGSSIKIPVIGTSAARSSFARREAKPTGGGTRYRVRSGDSLWKLAKRFRTNVAKLRKANGLSHRARLKVGQTLKIPSR